jgi:microcystin-dependent protein
MADSPFIGEIKMFGANFPPLGWALCNGQLMAISQNEPLFTLIGTTYGGDGVNTFGLPDLQGRAPIHQGTGIGLSPYVIGQKAGVENVTLTTQQMPIHTHTASAAGAGNTDTPVNGFPATDPAGNVAQFKKSPFGATSNMNAGAIQNAGGNQPHNNVQPVQVVTYIICLNGVFPPRS